MKKITLTLVALFVFSATYAQFTFTTATGGIVTNGTPLVVNINDSGNSASATAGLYNSFTITLDWENDNDAFSSEADLTVITAAGSVTIDPPTSGGATDGISTTLTFTGDLAGIYDPSVDGALDLSLNQSWSGSSANWSNISVTINPAPSCPDPTALMLDASSPTTADLSWTPGNSEPEWEYALLLATDPAPMSGTSTMTNSFMAMGLTPVTDYIFYVKAVCGVGDESEFIQIAFTTPAIPPVNDECSAPIGLTVNTDFSCGTVTAGTTAGATQSAEDATGVSGTADNDVWFSFVATGSEHSVRLLNVTAVIGTATDMGMAVYDATGDCGGLVFTDTSDPNNLSLSGLSGGTTYYVRVYGWSSTNTAQANFDICVGTPPPAPANDDCSAAESLTVNADDACAVTTSGTTASATASAEDATGVSGTPDNDVWYSFVAAETDHIVSLLNVTAVVGTSTDMGMAVYDATGACAGLVFTDTSDPNTLNLSGLTGGTTYFVRVYGWSSTNTAQANFDICIGTPPPPPANGDCGSAEMVTLGINEAGPTVTGSSTNASDSGVPDPSCNAFFEGGDIWYVFTTPADLEDVTLDIASSGFSSTIAVLYDNCTDLNEIACQVEFTSAPTMVFSGLSDNTTYYLRLYDFSNDDQGPLSFNISATTTLSLGEDSLSSFKYFPNPVSNVLSLKAQNNIQNISVYNMLGQEVLRTSPNNVTDDINMSSFQSGAYFVKVTINNVTETIRILKQ